MDYKQTIDKIKAGLTGEGKHDVAYLKDMCKLYKDSEFGKEIVRECGRLIFAALGPEARKKAEDLVKEQTEKNEKMIRDIVEAEKNDDLEKAERIAEEMIAPVRQMSPDHENACDIFVSFGHPLEKCIYSILNKPKKNIRQPGMDYGRIYMTYGSLMIDLKRFEDAEHALREACLWRPVSAACAYELAEVFKVTGRIDEMKRQTLDALRISYNPDDIARGFRGLGYFFVEKKKYRTANAMLQIAVSFGDDNGMAAHELEYIWHLTGKKPVRLSQKELEDIMQREGIPNCPSKEILAAHTIIIQQAVSNGLAAYALSLAENLYALTGDPQVKTLVDEIKVNIKE